MVSNQIEKRECERFVISGAAVHYKKDAFFHKPDYSYYSYPVSHMSKGGMDFLGKNKTGHLRINGKTGGKAIYL